MSAHSSVLAWRIPGTGEPGGLPSLGEGENRGEGREEMEGEVAGAPGPQRSIPQPDSWLHSASSPGRTGGWNPSFSFQNCLPTLKQRAADSPYPPVPPGLPADREPLGAKPSLGLPSIAVGEGEGGEIWENGIETCIIPTRAAVL